MACDTRLKPRQTISERAAEVRRAIGNLAAEIVAGRVRVRVGPQGAVTFDGFDAEQRDGVTDACAYRRLLIDGGALAKAAIARAEQMAGRSIDKQVVGQGLHSHDGGRTWERH